MIGLQPPAYLGQTWWERVRLSLGLIGIVCRAKVLGLKIRECSNMMNDKE
jgi:hypothetical protein